MVQRKHCSKLWIRAGISLDVEENIEKYQFHNGGEDRCIDYKRSESPTAHLENQETGARRGRLWRLFGVFSKTIRVSTHLTLEPPHQRK
jgi:hypothetical protein